MLKKYTVTYSFVKIKDFDKQILDALDVPVPDNLAERILLNTSLKEKAMQEQKARAAEQARLAQQEAMRQAEVEKAAAMQRQEAVSHYLQQRITKLKHNPSPPNGNFSHKYTNKTQKATLEIF